MNETQSYIKLSGGVKHYKTDTACIEIKNFHHNIKLIDVPTIVGNLMDAKDYEITLLKTKLKDIHNTSYYKE